MRPGKDMGTQLRRDWIAVVSGLLMAGAVQGVAGDAAPEYRIKARFVEWPATAFASADAPLVFCIFGRDPFDGALDQIANGKTINGRLLLIRRSSLPGELRSCHVV